MPLFDRDRAYGGVIFDDQFPLRPLDPPDKYGSRSKIKEESDQFLVWDCLGVTAENIPTRVGDADKVSFIVSSIDDPATRIEVGTLASAIVGKVKEALENAEEDIESGVPEDIRKHAFSDLPAVCRLQRVPGQQGQDALVLSYTCLLSEHGQFPMIKEALRRSERRGGKRDHGDVPF